MKASLLPLLSLMAATSCLAQLPYTEDQVIAYAKSIDVHTLDPLLPSQRLEDWLQSGPPQAHILRWLVADTCGNKPVSDEDYPLCAEVRINRNGEWGIFMVQIGTVEQGIVNTPRLYGEGDWGVGVEEEGMGMVQTGVSGHLSDLPSLLDQPRVSPAVTTLYAEIVARHPIGIPSPAEMATIRPLLSKRLSEQLQTARACQEDYFRRRQPTTYGKPGWLKSGIFSGDGKRALPIDPWTWSKERQQDGSFLVEVHLWPYVYLPDGVWRVVAKVIFEDGQFVIDDVRMFESFSADSPSHFLSGSFAGCDGSHWIGLTATHK